MADNRRRTFVTAMHRHKAFTESRKFLEATLIELDESLEKTKSDFAKFTEEHLAYVATVSYEEFKKEDKFFEQIDQMYHATTIEFRKRIAEIERRELISRAELLRTSAEITTQLENSADRNRNEDDGADELNLNFDAGVSMEPDSSSEDKSNNEEIRHQNRFFGPQSQVVVNQPLDLRERPSNLRERLGPRAQRNNLICNNCSRSHPMSHCPRFLALTVLERWRRVRSIRVCQNCFTPIHMLSHPREHRCRRRNCRCGRFHNTLLCHTNTRNRADER